MGFPDDDPDSEFPPDDPNLLRNRPIPDRLLVISAGIIANCIFAFSILFVQVRHCSCRPAMLRSIQGTKLFVSAFCRAKLITERLFCDG